MKEKENIICQKPERSVFTHASADAARLARPLVTDAAVFAQENHAVERAGLKRVLLGFRKIFPTWDRPGSGTGSLAWVRLVDTFSELGSQRRPSSAREQKTYPRENQKFEALVPSVLQRQ